MRKTVISAGLLCVAGLAGSSAIAQEMQGPPKVLEIQREYGKFGKGPAHQRNETAYVQAVMAAKSPVRYFAAVSTSGTNEAWFFVGHDSFDAYQKSSDEQEKNTALRAQLDRVMDRDADFISNGTTILATYDEKKSYHPNIDIAAMRYMEVETIRVRLGHDKEWEELVSLVNSTLDKAKMDVHAVFYDVAYGAPANTVLIFTPHKSLGEVDAAFASFDKQFMDALGSDGQKKLADLEGAAILSDQTELFAFDPKMSYPPDEWVKADAFWKATPAAKTAAAPAAASAKKPAASPTSKQ
ncbi:MAG TPA: hypothetical protein VFO34_13815 [Candidatus Acidoferrales bacterium]|nr:hypothetical protein [Candidatus Acidoferrales bacterium]